MAPITRSLSFQGVYTCNCGTMENKCVGFVLENYVALVRCSVAIRLVQNCLVFFSMHLAMEIVYCDIHVLCHGFKSD